METLRDRLAQALGDPTLQLAYWREQRGTHADATGRPVELPARGTRAVTHVVASGAPVAALIHDPAPLAEPDLIDWFAQTGLVLENEHFAAEVLAQLPEVRASRARIVAAADEERRRPGHSRVW